MQINGNSPAIRGTAPLNPTSITPPAGEAPATTATATVRPAVETEAEKGTRNLTNALVAMFGSMSPPVQAMFDIMTGGLTQKSYQSMLAKGVTVDHLKQAGIAFAPMLLGFQAVGQIQGAGALSWLNQAKSLEDLLKTPENQAKAGQALVDQLVGVIFPGPENALLRQGASELLTQGSLNPLTAAQLGASGLKNLAETLGKYRDLILEVAPGETAGHLNSMLYAVGIAASAPNPTGQSVNAAAQNALPPGMQNAGGTYAPPSADGTIGSFTSGSVDNWAANPETVRPDPLPPTATTGGSVTPGGSSGVAPGSSAGAQPGSTWGLPWGSVAGEAATTFGGSASTSGSVSGSIPGVPGGASYAASGDASAHYGGGAYASGSASLDENGLNAEGRVGVGIEAGVEANAHAEFNTGISQTTFDGHVDASVEARAEASGSLRVDGSGVHAEGHVGAAVRAEANASADLSTSLFGGLVSETLHGDAEARAEVAAEASGRLNAGFDEEGNFELDLGFDARASASAEAQAHGEATVNIFGFTFGVEGYASAQAGVEAEATGWLSYKDGQLRIGGGIGAALGIGAEVGGGIIIGVPPFVDDVISGVAGAVGAVANGIGDAVKGIGDFFGGLFGGGGGSQKPAAEAAMPTAPAWSLSDLGDWVEDLANGGTSAGTATA